MSLSRKELCINKSVRPCEATDNKLAYVVKLCNFVQYISTVLPLGWPLGFDDLKSRFAKHTRNWSKLVRKAQLYRGPCHIMSYYYLFHYIPFVLHQNEVFSIGPEVGSCLKKVLIRSRSFRVGSSTEKLEIPADSEA